MSEFMPASEINEPKVKLSELLKKYIAGDSHEHTVFSNSAIRHEADYTFEQVFRYVNNEININDENIQFIVFAEHASSPGKPTLIDGKAILDHQRIIHEFKDNLPQDRHYPELICGVETSIISAEGQVDVPDEILKQLDLVIGSKHALGTAFPEQNGNPNPEQITHLYSKLMDNENVDVIGHPDRMSDKDLENVDWDSLIDKAKQTHTALELNIKSPMPSWLIEKIVKGRAPIFIGTDTHVLSEFQRLPNGIELENEDERLNYPMGLKFSFWKKIARILRKLEECGATQEQVISSSSKRLLNWLAKEKPERKIEFQNGD